MKIKAGVAVFPGTNCDFDTFRACEFLGWQTEFLSFKEKNLSGFDVIIVPGGFSYGDYLRAGRLAALSPLIEAMKTFDGVKFGICNGFQIFCEAGLLRGGLLSNENGKFICKETHIDFLGERLSLDIAHKEGRYVCEEKDLKNYTLIKYEKNPNGSNLDIAGMLDRKNKILAMMPHPERSVFKENGNQDGIKVFKFIEKLLKE